LCEFRGFKTHLKWKYGAFRASIGLTKLANQGSGIDVLVDYVQ